jgi:two-component system sensor histidine kinase AtoS
VKLAGELATALAHEIKNPLAGIKVTMEALAAEPYLPGHDREVLGKVVGQIDRIDSLLKGILSFARPPLPQKVPTNMNAIIESAAAFSLQSAPGGGGTVSVVSELDARCPTIMADPMQLQQVFMNLLMNAADAMPDGGRVTVRTACDPAARVLRVEVADGGKGFSPEARERMFEPFFSTKAKGTGLGLAISKRLVEDHGGTLKGENRPEGGARFIIEFPVEAMCDGGGDVRP